MQHFRAEEHSFQKCWDEITARLSSVPKLHHWSAAGRAKGAFAVSDIGPDGIVVKTSKGLRFVPRKDFESIFPLWPTYRDQKLQRHKLSFCVNSTYVISVFHWLELQPK